MPVKATLVVGLAASRWTEHRPGGDPPPGQPARPEALTLLKFAVLPTPAIWPQAAALLEQAAEGDASATGRYLVDLTTPARGTVCPSDRLPFDPDFGARRSS